LQPGNGQSHSRKTGCNLTSNSFAAAKSYRAQVGFRGCTSGLQSVACKTVDQKKLSKQ